MPVSSPSGHSPFHRCSETVFTFRSSNETCTQTPTMQHQVQCGFRKLPVRTGKRADVQTTLPPDTQRHNQIRRDWGCRGCELGMHTHGGEVRQRWWSIQVWCFAPLGPRDFVHKNRARRSIDVQIVVAPSHSYASPNREEASGPAFRAHS